MIKQSTARISAVMALCLACVACVLMGCPTAERQNAETTAQQGPESPLPLKQPQESSSETHRPPEQPDAISPAIEPATSPTETATDRDPANQAVKPTPGESTIGDAKTGDAKTGDAKTGEAKTGEAKTGEAKTGEAKTGEAKTGEPKTGEPKTGEPPHPEALSASEIPPSVPPSAKPQNQNVESLFQDWPRPDVVFVLTGRQAGYIEPCGCTGLANQKGGLSRRHVLLDMLRTKRGWNVAPLDVGSQVRRYGAQAELKFQMSVDALKKLEYRGVAFGSEDLRLSIDALIAGSVDDSPFLSANASVLGLSATHKIFELGGRKIGVTSILGDEEHAKINNDEVELKPADAALAAVLAELKKAKCDYLIVLAHASLKASQALVRKHPDIDLIVTAGGAEEPAYRPEQFENSKTQLIQVGAKGMYAGVFGLFSQGETKWRFDRVPLDGRFSDSPQMLRLLKNYQEQLKTLGLEKLGVRPLPHPTGRAFVGSQTCAECHTDAFDIWKDSGHAHATESIAQPTERSDIPRHFDPECISCHVTGWNAQKFTPYVSGYLDFAKSSALHGSGCENCHGPGSKHVAAETGEDAVDDAEQALRQQQMRLSLDQAEKKCLECHDLDNSPDFHAPGAFRKYWEAVAH